MKVNPLKKLQSARKANVKENKNIISEVQLLLDTAGQEEREALRIVGLEHHVIHAENTRSVEIERKKFEEEYASSSFTETEIKDLCIKYDLRMLPTRLFVGKLDGEVASKLKAFVSKHKSEIGHYSDNFYVIAPPKAFKLEDQPVKPERIDPILVYKVPGARNREENQYILIHKWDKDFTLYRRLVALKYKSLTTLHMFWTLFLTLIVSAIPLIAGYNPITLWGYSFIPVVFVCWYLLALFSYYEAAGDHRRRGSTIEDGLGRFTTRDLWNNNFKRQVFR